jgi:RNA polymerase sigma-70 factor (ECF subfamily)
MNTDRIIERFNKGDQKAFAAIYYMFFVYLKHFAYSIIKDTDEAQDIAIIALEIAFEKPHEFESVEKLKAYLSTIVKNKCFKFLDTRARHNKSHQELAFLNSNDYEDFVESKLIRTEFLYSIYQEIKKLPPVRRKVFELLFIDQYSYEQVASELNMNVMAVYVNKSKALRDLRIILFNKKLPET